MLLGSRHSFERLHIQRVCVYIYIFAIHAADIGSCADMDDV